MLGTRTFVLTSVAAGAILFASGAVSAGTIGINFTGRTNSGTPELLHVEFGESSSGVAGVNENDVWNDVLAFGDSGMRGTFGPVRVTGSQGESAVVAFSSRGTWSSTAGGVRIIPIEDPNGDMMDGWIEGKTDSFPFTVTVSELSDDLPLYDIYAYVGAVGGRVASVTLNGTSTVTHRTRTFDGTFVEATEGEAGDYVLFRGVTGDSFVITGGGINMANLSGLYALELVGVPEPSTFVQLAAIALLGLGSYGWRRRRHVR